MPYKVLKTLHILPKIILNISLDTFKKLFEAFQSHDEPEYSLEFSTIMNQQGHSILLITGLWTLEESKVIRELGKVSRTFIEFHILATRALLIPVLWI